MDVDRVTAIRDLLGPTGWVERTREFARSLRGAARTTNGLLLVGTPQYEPWHLAAHLTDEARWTGAVELKPTLVRWQPPAAAPVHLSVGLDRIASAGRRDALLVVAPDRAPERLLERLADAKASGTTLLALRGTGASSERNADELDDVVHDVLVVPRQPTSISFDLAQHLVSLEAGEQAAHPRRGARARLARLLDSIAGATIATPSSRD